MLRINKMFCLRGWTFVLALLATVGATAARPQAGAPNDVAVLIVKGEVKQELQLTVADLKAMPRVKITAKDHDGVAREHEGVALQSLLAKAGVPQGSELRGKNMTWRNSIPILPAPKCS